MSLLCDLDVGNQGISVCITGEKENTNTTVKSLIQISINGCPLEGYMFNEKKLKEENERLNRDTSGDLKVLSIKAIDQIQHIRILEETNQMCEENEKKAKDDMEMYKKRIKELEDKINMISFRDNSCYWCKQRKEAAEKARRYIRQFNPLLGGTSSEDQNHRYELSRILSDI